jgi:transcriptional regulator with XRE-family HTH domain
MIDTKSEQRRGWPHPVDTHVGSQLRLRRTLLGMSQQKLGDALGLTFQQVQKYERGTNRIGASRLHELSVILDVPVGYFFEGLPTDQQRPAGPVHAGLADPPSDFDADVMTQRETIDLIRAYYRIGNAAVRRRLYELARALGGEKD